MLPKALLSSAWLKQIKTGREYPMFGYAQSKTIVRVDEVMAVARLDRGGAFSSQSK